MLARRRFLTILTAFLLTASIAKAHAPVTDEFVKNLKCEQLSIDSIYAALAPLAYGKDRWIDTNNGSDMESNVKRTLGDCWSLAHWQRLALTIGRLPTKTLKYSTHAISNLIRNTQDDGKTALTDYQVFAFPVGIWGSVDLGQYILDIKNDRTFATGRTYYNDLHFFQTNQFYRFSNLYYVATPRTESANAAELQKIAKLAVAHRLPMVILRFNAFDQHVVLIKDVFKGGAGKWIFEAIDPNNPNFEGTDHIMLEKTKSGFSVTYGEEYENGPLAVDVFLVGEDERPKIDRALLKYYKNLCH